MILYRLDPAPGATFLSTTAALGLSASDVQSMLEANVTPERARFIAAVAHNAATALRQIEPMGRC